jgi:hypothetical protein
MANYGINIRCTEAEGEGVAEEIRQMGYSARVVYDIGKRYPDEKPSPAFWLRAMVVVRGFEDEESIDRFTESFGLHRRGRCPYQSIEHI